MNKVKSIWNTYWYTPSSSLNYKVLRFAVLALGTAWLFIFGPSPDAGLGLHWQPISFFKFLQGPIAPKYLELIRYTWLFSGLIAGAGYFYAISSGLCAVTSTIYLGHIQNFGSVSHSTHLYVLSVILLSFTRADIKQSYSNRWPVQLIKLLVVWELMLSGLQKLYYGNGLNWAFSDSFYIRLAGTPEQLPLTSWILSQPLIVSQLAAAYALFVIQLSAPLSLLNKKFALFYVLNWTLFNFLVSFTIGSHYRFYVQIACYTAFIDWEYLIKYFKPRNTLKR